MKITTRTRRLLRLQSLLFVVLFLVVIGLLAWLSTRYVLESDWSASGRNTLSDASIALLQELPGEVTITAFARETPPLLRNNISALVKRYQRHKPDIRLDFVNPDRDPQRVRAQNISEGELFLDYGDHQERVREVTESGVTNALQRLARGERSLLLFLAGHGERDPGSAAEQDYRAWAGQLAGKGIASERINLVESPEIPADSTALVIASPQSALFPGEVELIENHVEQGGNLLWLTDPGDSLHGLETLAQRLGLRFKQGTVVDPTVSRIGMMMFGIDDPRVALVAGYPDHAVTRGFDRNTLFPVAGALAIETSDFEAVPILTTLSGAWLETGDVMGSVTYDEGVDIPGPLTLGVALTREIDNGTQRIFVTTDSDFLSNAFLNMGGNLQLGFNIANWLGSDDRFIEIPVRTAPDPSLELTPVTTAIIGFGFLLILPLLLLGSGLLVWYRRRRR